MTTPRCPKCNNSSFEIGEIKIQNANYRHNAIVCTSCGCIVGMEEWLSIMHMLDKIGKQLGVSFSD